MWICLNNAFVSIVEDHRDCQYVYVRGRRESDVKNFLGYFKTEVVQTDTRDYRFRAYIPKYELVKILAECVQRIDYTNFKSSVKDNDLEKMYTEVWITGVENLDPTWMDRQEFPVDQSQ